MVLQGYNLCSAFFMGVHMKIFSSYDAGRLTIYLSGELDHHGAKGGMKTISSLIDEHMPRDCVVDLSKLSFMDSSGIALLLRARKILDETGGRLRVENPAGQPLRVLDASGVDRVVNIAGSRRGEAQL
jgi:stage II sporulation protein AA (anti-sigma F factor antagonist)